jgi:hypothetical protein
VSTERRLARSRAFSYNLNAEKDMAGLVSPANSRSSGILSATWWFGSTAGRSDKDCHGAGMSWKPCFRLSLHRRLHLRPFTQDMNG